MRVGERALGVGQEWEWVVVSMLDWKKEMGGLKVGVLNSFLLDCFIP